MKINRLQTTSSDLNKIIGNVVKINEAGVEMKINVVYRESLLQPDFTGYYQCCYSNEYKTECLRLHEDILIFVRES